MRVQELLEHHVDDLAEHTGLHRSELAAWIDDPGYVGQESAPRVFFAIGFIQGVASDANMSVEELLDFWHLIVVPPQPSPRPSRRSTRKR